jgi:hypothetical protein
VICPDCVLVASSFTTCGICLFICYFFGHLSKRTGQRIGQLWSLGENERGDGVRCMTQAGKGTNEAETQASYAKAKFGFNARHDSSCSLSSHAWWCSLNVDFSALTNFSCCRTSIVFSLSVLILLLARIDRTVEQLYRPHKNPGSSPAPPPPSHLRSVLRLD